MRSLEDNIMTTHSMAFIGRWDYMHLVTTHFLAQKYYEALKLKS